MFSKPRFEIIRYHNSPMKATITLPNGKEVSVYREDKIFVPFYQRFIPTPPYDNHFIYENPDTRRGTSTYMCTCGSHASIAGMSAYSHDGSPQGLMFICAFYALFGKHTTGESRWI